MQTGDSAEKDVGTDHGLERGRWPGLLYGGLGDRQRGPAKGGEPPGWGRGGAGKVYEVNS